MGVVGLLLAAGAGRRMGGPKALLRDPDGTSWVVRAARDLRGAGCEPVRVVVGAAYEDVVTLLSEERVDGSLDVVVAADWREGMGASLRAGIDGLTRIAPHADAALVHLVDLPDVRAEVLARVAALAGPHVLARAVYSDRPGHPVLLGREHWQSIAAGAVGDAGARAYLARRHVRAVECGDLASGADVDMR